MLSFAEFLLILWCRGSYTLGRHIFGESVFAFILARKSDSFQRNEDNDSTHFLYSYVVMHSLCIYLILSKCGVLYRLFVSGFVRTFLQINGIQLHTFCLFIHYTIEELYGFEQRLLTQNINNHEKIYKE